MKIVIASWLFLVSFSSFSASIKCEDDRGELHSVSLKTFNDESSEGFFLNCQMRVYYGDICFTGQRKKIIKLLKKLDLYDILGDEYRMIRIWYHGKGVKYWVKDGPNNLIQNRNEIYRC